MWKIQKKKFGILFLKKIWLALLFALNVYIAIEIDAYRNIHIYKSQCWVSNVELINTKDDCKLHYHVDIDLLLKPAEKGPIKNLNSSSTLVYDQTKESCLTIPFEYSNGTMCMSPGPWPCFVTFGFELKNNLSESIDSLHLIENIRNEQRNSGFAFFGFFQCFALIMFIAVCIDWVQFYTNFIRNPPSTVEIRELEHVDVTREHEHVQNEFETLTDSNSLESLSSSRENIDIYDEKKQQGSNKYQLPNALDLPVGKLRNADISITSSSSYTMAASQDTSYSSPDKYHKKGL